MMSETSKKFQEWAKGLSGCDGGNVDKAKVWVCGIEPGGKNSNKKSLEDAMKQGIELNNVYQWKEQQEYRYGRDLAKLYTAIYDNDCKDLESYEKYIDTLEGNEVFKLNLYPVTFKDTSHQYWQDNQLKDITGFDSKDLYQLWCFLNRFPNFLNLRKKHKPKLVICTGVSYLTDFLICFAGSDYIEEIQVRRLKGKSDANKYERKYYHVKVDETLLVVIPFFSGSRGLNSYYLLNEMGVIIKALLNEG